MPFPVFVRWAEVLDVVNGHRPPPDDDWSTYLLDAFAAVSEFRLGEEVER
jgi:hypothetical protein